jgi:hypothetical protein
MSDNIRKIGNIYSYDFMLDGRRYRGSCKTEDKKLAENIADTIKADIIRKKHNLPRAINYQFGRLYFYYGVAINSTASLSGPTAQTGAKFPLTYMATSVAGGKAVGTSNVNSSCGGGFEAFAGYNFTGGNYQLYAVDDFTRTAALISGAAF